jgi:hypothetical protein
MDSNLFNQILFMGELITDTGQSISIMKPLPPLTGSTFDALSVARDWTRYLAPEVQVTVLESYDQSLPPEAVSQTGNVTQLIFDQ